MREWPEDNWVELARQLAAPRRIFLLTGAPADEARCDALRRQFVEQGSAAEVLIGRHGLEGIARVFAHAEVLVSVNTGIMHLGAILGVPTVSLNGPTSTRRWGPVGPRVANVCPTDGSGGFLDLGFEFRGNPTDTMEKIPVEDVLRAVRLLCGTRDGSSSATKQPELVNTHPRSNEDLMTPKHAELGKSG
jgi:heptosyltransferase I